MEFIDANTQQKQEDELKRRFEGEKKVYEQFKPPTDNSLLDPAGMSGMEGDYLPPEMQDPKARKVSSRKLSKKKGPAGSGSGSGAGPGMMPQRP